MEQFPEAVRGQLEIARRDYRSIFGCDPRGIWLPECAYFAGLDEALREAELRWFVLDSHGLMFGTPRPRYAIYAPTFDMIESYIIANAAPGDAVVVMGAGNVTKLSDTLSQRFSRTA